MKLLIQTAMMFFGTLLCAAVVALGEPVNADVAHGPGGDADARHQTPRDSSGTQHWVIITGAKAGLRLR